MRILVALAVSTFALAACGAQPGARDPMRALAEKNAADCKAHPELEKCKQAPSDGTSDSSASSGGGNVAVKLSNDCPTTVTFLFDGCGASSKRMFAVPTGGEKSVTLTGFTDSVTCSVCVAKGNDCKMAPVMFTTSESAASVSASGGCDSPSTH